MPLPTDEKRLTLAKDIVQAFDDVGGLHPGHRPAHAKGQLITGTFTPTREAAGLSRATHFHSASTPVVARFSDSTGIPNVPDNDPKISGPRGFAIRFQLGPHTHTDIVSHSTDAFPTHTAEEFLEFLRAVHASTPDAPHPNAIEQFLGGHPKALAFIQAPKPIPTSFARESFFSVTAHRFVDAAGAARHIRYRILPDAGSEYLDDAGAAAKGPNFLMEELAARLAAGPIKMQLWVQIAGDGDIVDDATVRWPEERAKVLLGVVTLSALLANDDPEGKRIIFDPIPRIDGIESSGDPLLEPRADVYVMSGRRRRAAAGA
jgi:catalase